MCNCGKKIPQSYSPQQQLAGNNQAVLKQIEQQNQQAAIRRVVEQSVNPAKTFIKTYS